MNTDLKGHQAVPFGRLLYQTDILERGWAKDEISQRLGSPRHTKELYGGHIAKAWAKADVDAAEAADAELSARVKTKLAKLAKSRALRAEREAALQARVKLQRAADDARRMAEYECRKAVSLKLLAGWADEGFDLTDYHPPKSMFYYPEMKPYPPEKRLLSDAVEMDESKLFHMWSEGTAKRCMVQVAWLHENGPMAVAVLRKLSINIPMNDVSSGSDGFEGYWRGRKVFVIRIGRYSSGMLYKFGDCAELMLLN
jgi:hypothetical protein